jgi:hypothetical protein
VHEDDRKGESCAGRILRRLPAAGWLLVQSLHSEEYPVWNGRSPRAAAARCLL